MKIKRVSKYLNLCVICGRVVFGKINTCSRGCKNKLISLRTIGRKPNSGSFYKGQVSTTKGMKFPGRYIPTREKLVKDIEICT